MLGVETSTLDAAGEVTATHDMSGVTDAEVRAAAAALTGDIEQIPPMVSAVKVGGRRLHELAREGKEVERQPRAVTVHRFDVDPVEGEPGMWRCEVDCSSGTYIRTLAADLGAALGGGAHLRRLRRTAVGGFGLDDAGPVEAPVLRPVADAVRHLASVQVGAEIAADVGHGRVLSRDRLGVGPSAAGPWAVFDGAGELLAVYAPHDGETKPLLVLSVPST